MLKKEIFDLSKSALQPWRRDNDYAIGQMVYVNGSIFKALTLHHSTTTVFEADEDKWELIVGGDGGGGNIPVGGIVPFSGDTLPDGFLYCRGQEISRTTFAQLFRIIGTAYGSGDGATTFNVPDLQGRIPTGVDFNKVLSTGYAQSRGAKGGSFTRTLTVNNLPSHSHTFTGESHTHTFTGASHYHGLNGHALTSQSTSSISTSGTYIPRILSVTSSQNDGVYDGIRLYKDNGDCEHKADVDWNYTNDITQTNLATTDGTNSSETTGGTISNVGSGTEFAIAQPYLAMDYIICYKRNTKNIDDVTIDPWITNVNYEVDAVVYRNGALYKCLTAHLSEQDFNATERANWELIAGNDMSNVPEVVDARTDVEGNAYTTLSERLNADEQEVIDARTNADGDVFTTLGERLDDMDDRMNDLLDWTVTTDYKIGDCVVYDRNIYRALDEHTSCATTLKDDIAHWNKVVGEDVELEAQNVIKLINISNPPFDMRQYIIKDLANKHEVKSPCIYNFYVMPNGYTNAIHGTVSEYYCKVTYWSELVIHYEAMLTRFKNNEVCDYLSTKYFAFYWNGTFSGWESEDMIKEYQTGLKYRKNDVVYYNDELYMKLADSATHETAFVPTEWKRFITESDMQEVINARTDADGNTYTSLKERLDTEQANTVISLDVKRIELVDQLPVVEEPGVLYLVKA